jgi:hypothetical protein
MVSEAAESRPYLRLAASEHKVGGPVAETSQIVTGFIFIAIIVFNQYSKRTPINNCKPKPPLSVRSGRTKLLLNK